MYSASAANRYSGSRRLPAGREGLTWLHHSASATVPTSRPMITAICVPVTRSRYSWLYSGMISAEVPTHGLAMPARRARSARMRTSSRLSWPSMAAGIVIRRGTCA
ncbi:hypothetical protein D3C85_1397400 [compost metagenome]